MTPQEIAALLQQHGSNRKPNDSHEPSEQPDSRLERTELLSDVLASCKDAWSTKSEQLDLIAEKLGDGSRDGESKHPYLSSSQHESVGVRGLTTL